MFQIKLESDEILFCPTWIVSYHNILHYTSYLFCMVVSNDSHAYSQ